ncbi:MAG TPA: hypothetical protein VF930_04475 [Stellaceae bacterium]
MGRDWRGWLVALAWLVPGAAAAQTLPGWEIGPEGYYYAYREPNLMHQIGPTGGVNASYTYKVGTAFLTANGIADVGYLNYKSNGTGNLNGVWDITGDLRLLAGADLIRNDWFGISPFTGLGYRVLYDVGRNRRTTTGAVAYDRLSQYFYIPVGLGFSFVAGNWILRPSAEYDYLVRGKQTSYLSQGGANADVSNTQTRGYGLRGTLLAETGTPWGRIAFGPFVRYWNIGESKPSFFTIAGVPFGGVEPHNKTLEAGATLRFRF